MKKKRKILRWREVWNNILKKRWLVMKRLFVVVLHLRFQTASIIIVHNQDKRDWHVFPTQEIHLQKGNNLGRLGGG